MSALIPSVPPLQANHFQTLYNHTYATCASFLSLKDVVILSRTCRHSYSLAPHARSTVTHLECVSRKMSDQVLSQALLQYPRITSLRATSLQLTERGLSLLGEALKGKEMHSIVLIDCKCLLSYPKQAFELLKKINFIKLQHLVLSDPKALKNGTIASDLAQDKLEFIHRCSQLLTAKLPTCQSLKTLDLSLLNIADTESAELVRNLPATLEYLGALPGSLHFLQNEMPSMSESVFTELSHKLPSCQSLTTLHICLSQEQIQQLIPILPSTMTELRSLHIADDATATCLIDNNFPDLQSCQLSFGEVSPEKVKQLLENLPFATMHKISLLGLNRYPTALHYLFEQLHLNTDLREIQLSRFDLGIKNGSLPRLLSSLNSNKLESLLIFGATFDETDKAHDKERTKLFLKEKLPSWPQIKQLLIFDHQTFFGSQIDLDSLQNKKTCAIQ